MHFLPLEEARVALSAQKANLEKARQKWLMHQTPAFQRLHKANQNAVNKQWNFGFIVLFVLVCFVINATISLSIFFILEQTVYTEPAHIATQGDRAMRALYSTLVLPVLGVGYAMLHNFRWKERSPNRTWLALVQHPDYIVWDDEDKQIGSQLQEINRHLDKLSRRGLLYIDGEIPANPAAVIGTLFIDGERITDLTYHQMPYEFHMDDGIYRVVLQSGNHVLFEQDLHLRHAYAATLDITKGTPHPVVDMQNMMRTTFKEERAKMSRRGTVYTACNDL